MLDYISIDFSEKVYFVENRSTRKMENKYELSFLGYYLYIESVVSSKRPDKETNSIQSSFSVYDKNKKLVKSRKLTANIKTDEFNKGLSLANFRTAFLFLFTTIKSDLLEKSILDTFKLNFLKESSNSEVMFYDKVEFFIFNKIFIIAGQLKSQKMNDIFIGDKKECNASTYYDNEFLSSIDYLLTNKKQLKLENDILLDLLYTKGE